MPVLLAIAIFAALSVAGSITSEGFLEADSCTHYLYARFAFEHPHYFVNIWGRPICTGIYAIPAAVAGRFGVHLVSLSLAIGCGLAAMRIARNQNYRWPALALIFTLAQPLVYLHSFSELTELPFALLLILAFWAYQQRRMLVMAILIALTPLSRPEGFGFIGLAALALVVHRRWWWLFVLPIPLLVWNHFGWMLYGKSGPWWRWLIDQWPYSPESLYRSGNLLHFVALLPAVVSPFVFPFVCIGIAASVNAIRKVRWNPSPVELNQCLIAAIPLSILVGHSVLYALGKMASSGEIRYMLIVAPFWGLLGARGWEWVATRFHWRAPHVWAGVAALLPIVFNAYYRVLPLVLHEDWIRARRAATWYEVSGIRADFPRIAAAHQGLFYFLDIATTDGTRAIEWKQDSLANPAPGVIVFWDPMYSIYNSDAARKVTLEDLERAGWIDVTDQSTTMGGGWRLLVSPQTASGQDARATPHFPSDP